MRLLSQLLIVLIISLAAIAAPTTPAQAADGASITLSPSSGVPGDEVTIYGDNFTAGEWVDIYYYLDTGDEMWIDDIRADPDDGDFQLVFIVPESYTGLHRVLAEDDEGKSAYVYFTVKPGLIVSPEEGPVGTNVTVRGVGFAEEEENIEVRYYVNGTYDTVKTGISAGADGSWQTSFPIPPSAQGSHRIDARGEDSTFAAVQDATFKVSPGISLNKSSGTVDESITMTGSGFAADERDIKILFAGEEVGTEPEIIRADVSGYWQASFQVPEKPAGEYSVTAEGEQTPKEDITSVSFEIVPGLVLSPDEGHVGTDLTVTGRGFAVNKDVDILYEDDTVTTNRTDSKGSFEVSFAVPESQHGERTVTAEDAAGNNATAIFRMESDPPGTPELISPSDGSRVGFVGKIRLTFKWSEVSDESGVYYSLQIATSANMTDAGFVDPVVSITRLVGTNCTLNATQALPYDTYYWIVRAVDRAGNAGNWTAVCSFRAGIMPLWGFILSIVGAVALIGTAVYYFIIRKRMYYY